MNLTDKVFFIGLATTAAIKKKQNKKNKKTKHNEKHNNTKQHKKQKKNLQNNDLSRQVCITP